MLAKRGAGEKREDGEMCKVQIERQSMG
jgi:hypothetical protein